MLCAATSTYVCGLSESICVHQSIEIINKIVSANKTIEENSYSSIVFFFAFVVVELCTIVQFIMVVE